MYYRSEGIGLYVIQKKSRIDRNAYETCLKENRSAATSVESSMQRIARTDCVGVF